MGLVKVNQENEGLAVSDKKKGGKESFGKLGASQQKSLIPVPRTSASPPKNDENASPSISSTQKARRPLAPMQHGDSPLIRKSTGKVTLTRKNELEGTPVKGKNGVEKAVGTDAETGSLPAGIQRHRNFPGTPQNSPSKLKARKSTAVGGSSKGLKLKSGGKTEESESVAYWKELAESRRQALEAALQENYELHKRVEELEKENAHLEEIVKEAEKLAIMVNDAAEEEELDESGIVDTSVGTAV